MSSISAVYNDDVFLSTLDNNVYVQHVQQLNTSHCKGRITAETLAKCWNIALPQAKKTIQHTTQLAVRQFSPFGGTKRLCHDHLQLRH